MDLLSLQLFLNVLQAGSLIKGAESSCFAPSTASRRLTELERELGVDLFDRGCRPIKPTECGKVLQRYAKQILDTVGQARVAIAQLDHEKIAYQQSTWNSEGYRKLSR